jgi:hypothetical protein
LNSRDERVSYPYTIGVFKRSKNYHIFKSSETEFQIILRRKIRNSSLSRKKEESKPHKFRMLKITNCRERESEGNIPSENPFVSYKYP